MKAKLIKHGHSYAILSDNKLIAFAHPEDFDNEHTIGKLSLKNCQAIELGYDLDELACKEIRIDISVVKHIDEKRKKISSPCVPLYEGGCVGSNLYNQVKGFEKGFQKALEILGDKKFSEEDMKMAIEIARNGSMQEQHNGYGRPTELRFVLDNLPSDKIIQSLQHTEWDVEVVIEVINNGKGEDGLLHETVEPKLDENGCLILKRI